MVEARSSKSSPLVQILRLCAHCAVRAPAYRRLPPSRRRSWIHTGYYKALFGSRKDMFCMWAACRRSAVGGVLNADAVELC